MKLSDLIAFIMLEDSGLAMDDVTYRAYDLDKSTGDRHLLEARRALGYSNMAELEDDLIGIGYRKPVLAVLGRWYAWHRLSRGEISRWPLRAERSEAPRSFLR